MGLLFSESCSAFRVIDEVYRLFALLISEAAFHAVFCFCRREPFGIGEFHTIRSFILMDGGGMLPFVCVRVGLVCEVLYAMRMPIYPSEKKSPTSGLSKDILISLVYVP